MISLGEKVDAARNWGESHSKMWSFNDNKSGSRSDKAESTRKYLEIEGRLTSNMWSFSDNKSGSRSDKAESTRKDFQAQRSNKTRKQNANIAIAENGFV